MIGKALYAVIVIIILGACTSKKGCIDPGSISFDPKAKIDDGSCTYPTVSLTPLKMTSLDPKMKGNSACKYNDNRIFTIIDAQGENSIYSLNMVTGEIKETIDIPGISAVNFEALANSGTHFYIGDIGNNNGNRTDLKIYKVAIPQAFDNVNMVDSYEVISFRYPEQNDFRSNTNTNYDAESLIFHNGLLYIFTKNHENNQTYLYSIPAEAGNYKASLLGTFDVKGLVTDADINKAGNKIVLIGNNPNSERDFIWLISDFDDSNILLGNKKLIDIGSLSTLGHVEGISFYDDNYVFLSNERSTSVDANLYYLDISSVK